MLPRCIRNSLPPAGGLVVETSFGLLLPTSHRGPCESMQFKKQETNKILERREGCDKKNKNSVHGVIAARLRRRCGREVGRDGMRIELREARVQGEVWQALAQVARGRVHGSAL